MTVWTVALGPTPGQEVRRPDEVTSTVKDGKRLLDCFRGVYRVPPNEVSNSFFTKIHGDFVFDVNRSKQLPSQAVPGIVHFGLGWSCPSDKVPEWSLRQSDGIAYTDPANFACFNSPFSYWALAQVEDLVRGGSQSGLLLDAFWWGTGSEWCCCEYCKQAYRNRFDEEMPLNPTWQNPRQMKRCIEWRKDTLESLYRLFYDKLKAIRPDLLVGIHGAPASAIYVPNNYFSRTNSLRLSDFAYVETYYDEIFYAAWLRGLSQKPTMSHAPYLKELVFAANDPISGYDNDFFSAVVSGLLAHGSRPIMWMRWLPDGGLNKSNVCLVEPVYREVEQKEPFLRDTRPILYAAIVYSESVKTYYGQNRPDRALLPHLEGVFETLQRIRVPVEFIGDMDLNVENLRRFQVIILPNTAILSQAQVQAIIHYVREGGSILATYETSLCDELGAAKANFDLAEVFGLNYLEKVEYDWLAENSAGRGTYLVPQGTFLVSLQERLGPQKDESLHMSGPAIITQPFSGISKATLTLTSAKGISHTNIPAVHFNNYGSGKSVYISTPIYKLIKMYHLDPSTQPAKIYPTVLFTRKEGWVVDLTRELLNELAPNPPLRVEGPHHLECTFFEQREQNRVIVHLLNSTVRELGRAYPLPSAKILIRRDFMMLKRAFSAWPQKMELQMELAVENRTGASAQDPEMANRRDPVAKFIDQEVVVPPTHIHQIVVLEGEPFKR